MNRRAGAPRGQPPPTGHAFRDRGPEPVPNPQARLLTAYRADARPTLRNDYQEAMDRAAHANNEYQEKLRTLLQSLPQGDGELPPRPTPEQMQVLFRKVLHSDEPRPRGKGSKGGVKHYECEWPECQFKGPLQKCIDHFFCEHVKLKFFKCDQPDCGITFLRKYDLDKHKKKQHALLRPREVTSQGDRGVIRPSRRTRSSGPLQPQPYSTQGRSTRGRPMAG